VAIRFQERSRFVKVVFGCMARDSPAAAEETSAEIVPREALPAAMMLDGAMLDANTLASCALAPQSDRKIAAAPLWDENRA
jgi:hypothetical protein